MAGVGVREAVSVASLKLWLDEIRRWYVLEFQCWRNCGKEMVWRCVDEQSGDWEDRVPVVEGKSEWQHGEKH